MVDLNDLPIEELQRTAAAGDEVMECLMALAKTGDNVVAEALRGQGTFYEFNHYPADDVYDSETHSQYYYHAHREGEHGHFHTYLRPKGMPSWIKPAPLPDFTMPEDENDALSHIVAISMDSSGLPINLFTTNRWICAETWYRAEDVSAMIDLFAITHAQPSWPMNRWVTAMLKLFKRQISELLFERDDTVAAWQKRHPRRNVYEDRELDITSEKPISLEDQITKIDAALRLAEGKDTVPRGRQEKSTRRRGNGQQSQA
ncbi:MAG: hypothetical protein IIB65_09580 [Proteobacteria bacterium]|nr:hypothetical protein [Pseudomonadota bacterium]